MCGYRTDHLLLNHKDKQLLKIISDKFKIYSVTEFYFNTQPKFILLDREMHEFFFFCYTVGSRLTYSKLKCVLKKATMIGKSYKICYKSL